MAECCLKRFCKKAASQRNEQKCCEAEACEQEAIKEALTNIRHFRLIRIGALPVFVGATEALLLGGKSLKEATGPNEKYEFQLTQQGKEGLFKHLSPKPNKNEPQQQELTFNADTVVGTVKAEITPPSPSLSEELHDPIIVSSAVVLTGLFLVIELTISHFTRAYWNGLESCKTYKKSWKVVGLYRKERPRVDSLSGWALSLPYAAMLAWWLVLTTRVNWKLPSDVAWPSYLMVAPVVVVVGYQFYRAVRLKSS